VPQYDPDEVYGEPVYSSVYRTHWYEAPSRGEVVTTGLVSFGAGVLVGQLFASHDHHDGPRGGWNAWNTSWGHGPGSDGRGRPSVVYDNHPYVVNRNTVVNRTVSNTYVDRSVHNDTDVHNRMDVHGASPGQPQRPDFDHMQRPNFTAAMTQPTARDARPDLRNETPRPAGPDATHPEGRGEQPMQRMDPRVANVHAVGARPQPFDNSHGAPGAPGHDAAAVRNDATAHDEPARGRDPGGAQQHLAGVPRTNPDEPSRAQAREPASPMGARPQPMPARPQPQQPRPQAHEAMPREHAPPAEHAQMSTPRPQQAPEQRQASRPMQRENHAPPPHRDEHKEHDSHDRHDG